MSSPPSYPSWFHESPVTLNDSLSTLVFVDNVPITKMNRYDKLCGVIKKLFSSYGNIIEEGFSIPTRGEGEAQETCGFAFIEYATAEDAARAVAEGNNKKLDNSHTLLVNAFDDFTKFENTQQQWSPPDKKSFQQKVNLTSWLEDEFGRDQYTVRFQRDTHVYWNDPARKASEYGRTLKYGGEREKENDKTWTDSYVGWSSRGSYLSTFHVPGIAIWGGESFEKLGRFAHPHVQSAEFSPNEKYLITYTQQDKVKPTDPEAIIVWDVRNQKKLRGFTRFVEGKDGKEMKETGGKDSSHHKGGQGHSMSSSSLSSSSSSDWTPFKFSHDDKYVARLGDSQISIYELPQMDLLEKKSLKIPGVTDFVWSPTANVIAYYVPETTNSPATVAIVEIPSRQVIREKHLFHVTDAKLHWQDEGAFLCMQVTRKKTKGKANVTNFEIFRMKEKEIPIEVIEVEDHIVAFAWEPKGGEKFAIIHGEGQKTSVSLYSVKGKKVMKIHSFEGRSANALFWSPNGATLLLAGLGSLSGQLEWIDVDNGESLSSNEHFNCTDIEWSPCGRYLITAVTQPIGEGNWKYSVDNGYKLWSFTGLPLSTISQEKLHQVIWRPRPANLLTKEQLQEIQSKLKEKYWKKFDQEDEEIRKSQLQGRDRERAELKAQWKAYRLQREREYAEEREMRKELRGYVTDDENDYITMEEWQEEEVAREEEIMN